jgi:general L-amino acid transport system substrate-binding protein
MNNRVRRGLFCIWAAASALLGQAALAHADPGVLEAIRARGHVLCGVGNGPKGYSSVDAQGVWTGIGVDFCRALAVAVLGNKGAVTFKLAAGAEDLQVLHSGEIDVLVRNVGATAQLDMSLGLRFAGVLVYEGQGFMVRKAHNITSALELSGARICAASDGPAVPVMSDYFAGLKMPFDLVKADRWPDAVTAYAGKGCQVLTGDIMALAEARQGLPDADEHVILPEVALKIPVGPWVRQGDDDWFSVVRWALHALIAAEEFGITSTNVDAVKGTGSPDARRFLTADKDPGKRLGLPADWTYRVVRQIGNYGELFERYLGPKSPLKLERRLNNLWSKGGLHYSPPFR